MATVDTSSFSAADRAAAQSWLASAAGRWGHRDDPIWPVLAGDVPAAFGAGIATTVNVTALNSSDKAALGRILRAFAIDVQPSGVAGLIQQLATDVEA